MPDCLYAEKQIKNARNTSMKRKKAHTK